MYSNILNYKTAQHPFWRSDPFKINLFTKLIDIYDCVLCHHTLIRYHKTLLSVAIWRKRRKRKATNDRKIWFLITREIRYKSFMSQQKKHLISSTLSINIINKYSILSNIPIQGSINIWYKTFNNNTKKFNSTSIHQSFQEHQGAKGHKTSWTKMPLEVAHSFVKWTH